MSNILSERFNEYRVMWVLVFFDLPTLTAKERKDAALFRKNLIKDGFTMLQFSIYVRHSSSWENADVHEKRVKSFLPKYGNVCIIQLTDKQFGNMVMFTNASPTPPPSGGIQLELF